MDRETHIRSAEEALRNFQRLSGSEDGHSIADLICDLGHLSDERGLNFLQEVERGIGHWYAERGADDVRKATSKPEVKIRIRPATKLLY